MDYFFRPADVHHQHACPGLERGCLHGLPPRTAVLRSSPASEQTSIHWRLEVCYSTVHSHVVLDLPAGRFQSFGVDARVSAVLVCSLLRARLSQEETELPSLVFVGSRVSAV